MNTRRKGTDFIVFQIIFIAFICVFALLCVLPFWMIIVGAFTDEMAILRYGYSLWPSQISLAAFDYILIDATSILRAYSVTIFVTVTGTIASVFLTIMTAYVLSRKDFKYRNFFALYFYFTTLFSGGLVPWYILISQHLQLRDNILVLILPMLISVWNILIAKGFLRSIPDAITEAAKVDGAGDFSIFMRIIMPLSKPAIATIGLFTALTYWNDWFLSMLFINDESLYSLQFFLYRLMGSVRGLQAAAQRAGVVVELPPVQSTRMAMTLIVVGPIIFLFPFLQKYFVKGITLGSVKE